VALQSQRVAAMPQPRSPLPLARDAAPSGPWLPREIDDAAGDQKLGAFIEQWLPSVRASLKPSTWDSYRSNLINHVLPALGERPIGWISPMELNRFYAQLLADGRSDGMRGLAPKTVHYIHTIIHRALRDAQRWGVLRANPAGVCDPPRQVLPEVNAWAPEDARRFLSTARGERLYPLYLLAITTGMRRGELLALTWSSLDLASHRLFVRASLVTINYELHLSTPKTRRSRRSIELDPATVTTLQDHRLTQQEERTSAGTLYGDRDLVFARPNGDFLHPHSVSQGFVRLLRRHRLPIIRFHDLRHTSATLALAAGVHPKVVSERLGHSSVTITLDTYSHVVPTLQKEAARMIANVLE
jgi:integrase